MIAVSAVIVSACLMRTTMCFPTYDSWPCWETADLGEHHIVDLAV